MVNRRTLAGSAAALVVVMPLLASSCSSDAPDLVPVEGTVTHDGAPLPDADVIFVPEKGPTAVGKTGADGRFQLATGGEPGALVGKHKVAIQAVTEASQGQSTNEAGEFVGERLPRIPEIYGNFETSGLSADVTGEAEKDKFTFELTGAPEAR